MSTENEARDEQRGTGDLCPPSVQQSRHPPPTDNHGNKGMSRSEVTITIRAAPVPSWRAR